MEFLTPEVISPLRDETEPPPSKKSKKADKKTTKKVRKQSKETAPTPSDDVTPATRKRSTRKTKTPELKTENLDENDSAATSSRKSSRKATPTTTTQIEPVHLSDLYVSKEALTDDASVQRRQEFLKPVLHEMLSLKVKYNKKT